MEEATEQFLELLHDKTFKNLYRRTNNESLGWAQFKGLTMPEGYNAEQVWHILTAIRRIEAHVFPYKPYTHRRQPTETWCSTDNAVGVMLRELVVMAREDEGRDAPCGCQRHLRTVTLDLAAAMHRDGFEMDANRVFALVTHRERPVSGKESVVVNAADLLADMSRYAKYPFSPWMLEEWIVRLEGDGLAPEHEDWVCKAFPYGTQTTDQFLEDVYKTVNDRTQSLEMHLLDLIATYVAFWDLVPLPAWNGLVEVFLRGWATERSGLTGLKSVPFSHLCLRAWGGNEDFGKTDVTDGPYGVNPDIGEAHDATSFYGNVLRLAIDALHEEQQARCDEQEHASSDAQTAGHKLNRRQKDALESLLPDSAATMTITAYMRLYQVSYGTARADLLGLAEQGLLEQGYAGRALVFRAREKAE